MALLLIGCQTGREPVSVPAQEPITVVTVDVTPLPTAQNPTAIPAETPVPVTPSPVPTDTPAPSAEELLRAYIDGLTI